MFGEYSRAWRTPCAPAWLVVDLAAQRGWISWDVVEQTISKSGSTAKQAPQHELEDTECDRRREVRVTVIRPHNPVTVRAAVHEATSRHSCVIEQVQKQDESSG